MGTRSSVSCGRRGGGSNQQVTRDSNLCWISLRLLWCVFVLSVPPVTNEQGNEWETGKETDDQHKDVCKRVCGWIIWIMWANQSTCYKRSMWKKIFAQTKTLFWCAITNVLCLTYVCFMLIFLPDIVSDSFWFYLTVWIFNGQKNYHIKMYKKDFEKLDWVNNTS